MAYNSPQELCLISSQTASASATISFTSGISSNFNVYVIKLRNIRAATNGTFVNMLWSIDGGSTYLAGTSYKWGEINSTSAGLSQNGSSGGASFQITEGTSSSNSRFVNGEIQLFNLSDTNVKTYYSYCESLGSSGNMQSYTICGVNTGTTAVNAIRIQMSSGNITSGTLSLYGVNE